MFDNTNNMSTSDSVNGPLVRLHVEAFLDEHPDFLESYVIRKVKPSTFERWQHQFPVPGPETVVVNLDQDSLESDSQEMILSRQGSFRQEGFYAQQVRKYHSAECTPMMQRSFSATPMRRKSAAVTPHRKISAATFEDGCQAPILKQEDDGSMSFLTIPPVSFGRTRDIQMTGEGYVTNESGGLSNIPGVHDNLTSDMNESSLCFKIAKNLSIFSKAISTTIFQVKGVGAKTFFTGSAVKINKKSVDEIEENSCNLSKEFQIFLMKIVAERKSVSFSKIEIKERFGNVPFLEENYCSLALILLVDVDEKVQGVALLCLGDNIDAKEVIENKLISDVSKLSGICLKNASDFHSMRLELTRSQVFLELARVIFDNQMSIEFTVLKMLVNFLNLIQCERAQILLSSKEEPTTFNKVYDLEDSDLKRENFENLIAPFENRFPINSSIIGLVASLGETVNIGDNSCDSSMLQEDNHHEHRSLLCMPIKDGEENIIGVVTLINKKTGIFTSNDESFVEAFGIFCGIALDNVYNYEQLKAAEARKQVALDIMTYHAASNHEESEMLAKMSLSPSHSASLYSFSFTDEQLEDIDTLTASLKMFQDLELMKIFNLDHKTMCRWLLTVKKNYRPEVVYHNWRHAFNVCQVMYSCLVNSGWWETLGPVTCLGLLVACLCHDIDHRGTNSNYLQATNSPLAKLYSSSTLERHHLNQALIILNLDGHRILDNLSPGEYSKILSVIEHAILATDLAVHFSHLGRLNKLAASGSEGIDWESDHSVNIVTAALMTAADLGATTKPWDYQQKIAGMVAEEFWYQGDLEKSQLSSPLVPMFDRDLRHELPKLQVGFCQGVCLPVYRALGQLNTGLKPLEDAVLDNRDKWDELAKQNTDPEEDSKNKVTRNL